MAYKIRWEDGSKTREAYSNKALANKVLEEHIRKGKVVKDNLSRPGKSTLGKCKKMVYIRSKTIYLKKGFVYRPRCITSLTMAEKKRVVKKSR